MKNKILLCGLAAILLKVQVIAQNCDQTCLVNSIDISTGFNHGTGVEYPIGSRDGYWQVVQVPAGFGITETVPYCAHVIPPTLQYWLPDLPNAPASQWISVVNTSNMSNNNHSSCSGTPGAPFRFTRTFEVCGTDRVEIRIDALYRVDDYIRQFYIDGQPIGSPINCAPGNGFTGNPHVFSHVKDLHPGIHTISFDLYNSHGEVMGINMQASITITNPNIKSLVRENCAPAVNCACSGITGSISAIAAGTVSNNCLYDVTLNVNGTNNIVAYEWWVTGSPHVVHANTSSTDIFNNVSVPQFGSTVVWVTVHSVTGEFQPPFGPCCSTTFSIELNCVPEDIPECEGLFGSLNSQFTGVSDDDECLFTCTGTGQPAPFPWTPIAYNWLVNTFPAGMGGPGASHNINVPVMFGVNSEQVSVQIIYTDDAGHYCRATHTDLLNCSMEGDGWVSGGEHGRLAGLDTQEFPDQVRIYPNPSDGYYHLDRKVEKITVYDLTGRKLMELHATEKIDGNQLTGGNYLLTIEYDNKIEHRRIIRK